MIKRFTSALNIGVMIGVISALVCGCASFSGLKLKTIPLAYIGTQDDKIDANKFWPDAKLKDAFEQYWALRYTRDTTKASFAMETPYFQEMVDEKRYNMYIGSAWQNEPLGIRFLKIRKETDNLCTLVFDLNLKLSTGEVREVSIADQWVKVRGKWYHVLKDVLIFPDVS